MAASPESPVLERIRGGDVALEALFEHSPVGMCQIELQSGKFLRVNKALASLTEYRQKELLARSIRDLSPPFQARRYPDAHQLAWLPAAQPDAVLAHLSALPAEGGSFGPLEQDYRRKSGKVLPVLVSGMRVTEPDGTQAAWVILQDISRQKAMERKLSMAANQDALTGLPTRSLMMTRIEEALSRLRSGNQKYLALLFLDFDRFKLVNDSMGHEAGDELLRQIATRLTRSLRARSRVGMPDGAVAARFGGDEFLVLLNDLHDPADAKAVAQRLLRTLGEPYPIRDRKVYSNGSIGIVTCEAGDDTAETIIRNADVAMYEAKRQGRARAIVFDDAMRSRLTRYLAIEQGLRQEIGGEHFHLVYQPVINLASEKMIAVEALVRWTHPDLGAISPAEFVPIAEESGLSGPLSRWVLREACMQLATWQRDCPESTPRIVSVNIARADLASGEKLLSYVDEALEASGMPPHLLRLEVTERDVMRNPAATLALMGELRERGVHLAMDDFGTGTSSLGCLRDYPFDVLKFDKSLIDNITSDPASLAVLHASIMLAQNMGKHSVAEGVETAQQVAILQSLGCTHVQGYYFSRPLPPELVPRWREICANPTAS